MRVKAERNKHFYPRSPCGERHIAANLYATQGYFYPRSPCGERPTYDIVMDIDNLFLSTLSLRRATPRTDRTPPPFWISIHALLAESDPL